MSPPAGTYFAMFNGSFHHSTSAAITTFNICANGVTVDNSIRTIGAEAIANDRVTVQTSGFATVSAGQAIDVRWSTTANSATGYNRGLYLMRVR